ncbi:uncharacterized protein MELLADRAFT_68699 [Melampsora larici-populina 98AG31]|uniref:SET domain-containing protein n=1 Tax=Melampsora larici-populina (strain 98AG31 / pathotype 3-4-7) TaxID=747676 RepID=F4S7V7_MELLP|nr:uncharacterized protein MELLADRAFT_68699 [Melampsora larici-populina 98AG31]EGF99279.1 hypothetical protein MELLADRAFT_68699 [Melampsora larici-populina 98AG31]
MQIGAFFLTHFLVFEFVQHCRCNNQLQSTSLSIFIKPETSIYTQQACISSSSEKTLLKKVPDAGRHNTPLNATRLGSSDARSSRALKSSVGLVYKFDQVDVEPILESSELNDLDGFVKQQCYSHEDDDAQEPICIYLNYKFDHGRGMVFLSYPSIFKEILTTFTIFKTDKAHTGQEKTSEQKFEVVDMPQKGGKGSVASRRFYPGDPVVSEHLVFIMLSEPEVFARKDINKIMKRAVDYLPFETRATFATLHGEGDTQEDWIRSTFKRNNFYIPLKANDREYRFGAIVFQPTRLNHDCRPNTAYYVDGVTLTLHMHALRDIAPGEELTDSYIDTSTYRDERKQNLQKNYGFDCTCSICSLPSHMIKLSDYHIEKIQKLNAALDNYTPTSIATPGMAEQLINLYKLERLDITIYKAYTRASVAYNAVGDTDQAKIYAALALTHGLIAAGPRWSDWPTVLKLEQNPEEHWSYKSRLPKPTS